MILYCNVNQSYFPDTSCETTSTQNFNSIHLCN